MLTGRGQGACLHEIHFELARLQNCHVYVQIRCVVEALNPPLLYIASIADAMAYTEKDASKDERAVQVPSLPCKLHKEIYFSL